MSFSPIVLFQSPKESAGILNCLKYLFIYLWKKSVSYNYLPLQPTRRMSHLDALAEKLNSENDKTGFFQMVNRSSRLNASSYSLSSLYSVGSINCGSTVSGFTTTGSRHESARNRRSSLWQGPSAIKGKIIFSNLFLKRIQKIFKNLFFQPSILCFWNPWRMNFLRKDRKLCWSWNRICSW